MKEKYKYIVLPPDGVQLTLRDRLFDARSYIPEIVEVITRIKKPEDKILIKYRSKKQLMNYPFVGESKVGYGTLLNYLTEESIVIGPPIGSATIECLYNDYSFYSFLNFKLYQANEWTSAYDDYQKILHIAQTKEELFYNLSNQKIYQAGKSKDDLIHKDGLSIKEIVSIILKKRDKN